MVIKPCELGAGFLVSFGRFRAVLLLSHACPLAEPFFANKIGLLANKQKEKP